MSTTDIGHQVVAYVSSVLLVILLASYAPLPLLAGMAVTGAAAVLWYCIAWPTDGDDAPATSTAHAQRIACRYGAPE